MFGSCSVRVQLFWFICSLTFFVRPSLVEIVVCKQSKETQQSLGKWVQIIGGCSKVRVSRMNRKFEPEAASHVHTHIYVLYKSLRLTGLGEPEVRLSFVINT